MTNITNPKPSAIDPRPTPNALRLAISAGLMIAGGFALTLSILKFNDRCCRQSSLTKKEIFEHSTVLPELNSDVLSKEIQNYSIALFITSSMIVVGFLLQCRRFSLKTLLLASIFIGAMGALPRLFGMS